MGQVVTTDDVEALPILPDSARDAVREMRTDVLAQAKVITQMRADGQHQAARRMARGVADEHAHVVGHNRPEPPDTTGMSPREIADLIVKAGPAGH
jgi:hypothetical protein